MKVNIVVLTGRLVVAPPRSPLPYDPPGRLLLTVSTDRGLKRTDMVGVAADPKVIPDNLVAGDQLMVVGALVRTLNPVTGRSRLEVRAGHIERRPRATDSRPVPSRFPPCE